MTTALAIALVLFIAALVIFVIDLLIPSGGILIGVTACLAFAAVIFAFRHSPTSGIWMLIATLSLAPIMMWVLIVVWPKTPLGRRMIVEPTPPGDFVWADAAKSGNVNALIGAEGVAETELLPSGQINISGELYEGFSETGPIEAGEHVRVVRIDVGRLVVTKIRKPANHGKTMSDGTGLDRPITDLDFESLDS